MQRYAESAVDSHMQNLQNEFDKQNRNNDLAPFREVTNEEIDFILKSAMKRSDRWRKMKKLGKSEKEIKHDELIKDFVGFEKIIVKYL